MADAKPTTTKKAEMKEAEMVAEAAPIDEVTSETSKQTDAQTSAPADKAEPKTAKAGKRSSKALKEAEAKEAKEARKTGEAEAADAKPKQAQKPTRSRLERRGKNFRAKAELIDKAKQYTYKEAVELAKKTSPSKFDASVELHINLNVDPRQADQNVRDNLLLPAGSGKTVRVAVFAEADDAAAATSAGADIVGNEAVIAQLDKNTIDFDVLIATPSQMPKLGKYARLLGPRGLMPNPKSGTVTTDINKAVAEAKAGRVEYRVDSSGIVHLGIGKASFSEAQLLENLQAVTASIKANKPGSIKGTFVRSIYLTTTMGPSIPVSLGEL